MIKDVLNGLSPITVVCLMVFLILSVIGTLAPYFSPDHTIKLGLYDMLTTKIYEYNFVAGELDIISLTIPFIIAIIQFNFLHRKDCCYTFLSFAIKRKKLYTNRAALPLISMILIALTVKGISLGVNVSYFGFDFNILKGWIIHVIVYLQILLVIYAITVFCCHFCGRTIEAVISSLSFLILPFAMTFLSEQVFSFSLYGYNGVSATSFTEMLELINPLCIDDFGLTAIKTQSVYTNNFTGRIISSSIWIIISIIILFATKAYFAKGYKPEIIGFKGAKTGTIYIISLSLPLFFAFFGFEMVRSYYYPLTNTKITVMTIVITILLGFLGAILCNFTVHFTFKKFKVALAAGATIAVLTGIVSLIGLSGIFGTFNKLPTAAEIEYVSITYPFSNFVPTINYSSYLDDTYASSGQYTLITNKEDIELVLDIHKNILKDKKTESVSKIDITYQLKDGTVQQRTYNYLSDSTIEKGLKLWECEATKKLISGYLLPEDNYNVDEDSTNKEPVTVLTENSKVEITSKYNKKTEIGAMLTYKQSYELRKAVEKDILALSSQEWFRPTEKSLGQISFKTFTNKTLSVEKALYTNEFFFTTPIYDSMENTIAVLEKYDLINLLTDKREVKKLYIADFKELAEWTSKNLNKGNAIDLLNPYFTSNFYLLQDVEAYSDAPIKEVTDKKEIEKYIEDGYTHYLIGNNNATYVMVEFEDSTPNEYQGNIYMIPKK